MHRFWVVGNPESGDKTNFEDISSLKSATVYECFPFIWPYNDDPVLS